MNYKEIENHYSLEVYPKRDVVLVQGRGAVVVDELGCEYIDCVGGHGVAVVGHCNEEVVRAIQEQAQRLITCSGVFYNDVRARFLAQLVSIAPRGLERAFLCNSGTEAVEAALKCRYKEGFPLRKDFPLRGRFSRSEQLRQALAQNPEAKYSMEELSIAEAFEDLPADMRQRLVSGEKVGE